MKSSVIVELQGQKISGRKAGEPYFETFRTTILMRQRKFCTRRKMFGRPFLEIKSRPEKQILLLISRPRVALPRKILLPVMGTAYGLARLLQNFGESSVLFKTARHKRPSGVQSE